jgi:hypothetical protein
MHSTWREHFLAKPRVPKKAYGRGEEDSQKTLAHRVAGSQIRIILDIVIDRGSLRIL